MLVYKFHMIIFVSLLAGLGVCAMDKCCICKRQANNYAECNKFRSSANYQQFFIEAFGLTQDRQGSICQVCVLAITKWKKSRKPAYKVRLFRYLNPSISFQGHRIEYIFNTVRKPNTLNNKKC